MNKLEKTVLLVDPVTGINTSEFASVWNAHALEKNLPIATVEQRPTTYDADVLSMIGHVSDFVGILGFIGVPSVWEVIHWLNGQPKSEEIVIEEIIIERPGVTIKKITIRKIS